MAKLLLTPLLVVLLCAAAGAQSILLEAEDYIASHNEGGSTIYPTQCGGASNGRAVEGFDYPGDWIELTLDLSENGAFEDSLRSGGLLLEESDIRSTVFAAGPSGEDQISAFHTIGDGIG